MYHLCDVSLIKDMLCYVSNTRLFAADTILYKVINQQVSAGIELNTDLKIINEWASKWLVYFQPLKTKSFKKCNIADHPIL